MRSILPFLILLPSAIVALGGNSTITTTPSPGLLQLGGSNIDGQILLSSEDWWGVIRAAEDLAHDFGKVTGKNLTLGNWVSGNGTGVNDTKVGLSPRERKGWGWGPRPQGPPSRTQNSTQKEGGDVTGFYEYTPVISFVHVRFSNSSFAIGLQLTDEKQYTTAAQTSTFRGPTLRSNSSSRTVLIVGTLHKSPLIYALVKAEKLDVKFLEGKWESYISQVVQNPLPGVERAMVVVGSDARGTIFGCYDLSEQIGVSPWWWWADVPVKRREGVWALGSGVGGGGNGTRGAANGRKVQGEPTVRYRGIFINDEQPALTNWVE